jgi:hypothetical protein
MTGAEDARDDGSGGGLAMTGAAGASRQREHGFPPFRVVRVRTLGSLGMRGLSLPS